MKLQGALVLLFVIICVHAGYVPKGKKKAPKCVAPPPVAPLKFSTRNAKPKDGSYPKKEIRQTLNKNLLLKKKCGKLSKAAAALLKLQKKAKDLSKLVKPAPVKTHKKLSKICPVKYITYKLKPLMKYKGGWCWLLKPWWGIKYKVTRCLYRRCRFYKWKPILFYRYFCRPDNYVKQYYILYCKHLKQKIQIRYFRYPRCCSCYRWNCFKAGKK